MKNGKNQSSKRTRKKKNDTEVLPRNHQPFISKKIFGGGVIFALLFAFLGIADGRWEKLWVKGIILGALILATIWVFEFAKEKIKPAWVAFSAAFLFAVVFGGLIISLYWYYSQWRPPELPDGCEKVSVTYGSSHLSQPLSLMKPGQPLDVFGINGVIPFSVYVINKRFYANVNLAGPSGTIKINGGNIANRSSLPLDWDSNHSSNAVEIVNKEGIPMLQVYYRRPEEIVIRGFFQCNSELLFMDENKTVIMPIEYFHPSEYRLNPIFKYPSWNHPGEYAN